jgi:hypothetical protein
MADPKESGVRIPEQILKQAEEAERLHQEFMASLEPEKPKETPAEPVVKTEPVEKEPVVPKVEPAQDKIDELTKAKERAEHQYSVLQGKYNAEVPEFALKLTEAKNKILQLEAELNASKISVKKEVASIEEDPSVQYLKTDLPEVWKAFNLVIDQKAGESAAEIKRLKEDLEASKKVSVVSDREKFYENLSGKVENWETINASSEWVEWLRQPEPYSGLTRQELINDAYGKMDSKRTARFFSDYIEEAGLVKEKAVEREPVKEVAREVKTKKEDIVPATTVTNKPDIDKVSKEKPEIVSASEVTQYYRELERLARMGQKVPDDLAVRGIQIDKAVAEGRIQ